MKMMWKRKRKQLKSILPPQKAAGRVLEGEIADQVKELVRSTSKRSESNLMMINIDIVIGGKIYV